MNKRLTLTFLSLIFVLGSIHAQSMKAYVGAASEAVDSKDFGSALYYYRIIVDQAETSDIQQIYNAAETARKYRSYEFAESWYIKVLESEEKNAFPAAWFGLGSVRKNLGKYELAKEAFTSYLSVNPDGNHSEQAKKDIQDCDTAIGLDLQDDGQIIHLDEKVNTPYSEVSALRIGDELYYSSMRFQNRDEQETEYCCAFGRTLSAKTDAEGQLLAGDFNDSTRHTINSRLNSEENRMYYNSCYNINAAEVRCEIYYREIDETGAWGSPVRLSDRVNLEGYTATQPSVGVNSTNGKTYLFFSSDRPEGKGGMDIWCSVKGTNGEFSSPVNIDAFNTAGDDITPFYHAGSNRLFYSSDSRSGLGGFDIYVSSYNDANEWSEASALEYPVNTSFDEAFFSLSSGLETPKGYFSSNRPGTLYTDTLYKYSCNDIFSYDIAINLNVLTFNAVDSLTAWDSCTVQLVDLSTGEIMSLTNLEANDFSFTNLKSDREYMLIANREGYYSQDGYVADTLRFDTYGVYSTKTIEKKLYLIPKVQLQVLTFAYDAVDTTSLAGCNVELFNITTGQVVLDSLIPLASNPLQNEFLHKYLLIGNRYRITATKEDYTQAVTLVSLDGNRSEYLRPRTITRKLYLRCELCDFELLQIYFNNDEPGPHTRYDLTTEERYDLTYDLYYAEKDNFKNTFPEDDPERDALEAFFEGNVKGGMVRLRQFAEILDKYVKKSNVRITVLVEGYASPLSNPVYNLALTERRVKSVEKYFEFYSNDLKQAITTNRLELKLVGFGEDKAEGGSEDRKDVKNSIFNVAASKERRVEIKQFRIIREPN